MNGRRVRPIATPGVCIDPPSGSSKRLQLYIQLLRDALESKDMPRMPEASPRKQPCASGRKHARYLSAPCQVTTFLKSVLTFVNDAASAKPEDRVAQYRFGENVLVRR
jgi:hypothetical protein